MKHIMISIKPEYVCKILNKEKLLEIRKSIPKCILNGEECIVEIYCTKDQNKILAGTPLVEGSWKCWNRKDWNKQQRKDCGIGKYNGKVVARWHLKKYDEFEVWSDVWLICDEIREKLKTIRKNSCLSQAELLSYLGKKYGYAWHIDDLKIYDKPKELDTFYIDKVALDCGYGNYNIYNKVLKRPPQSWCYIEGEIK